MCINGNRDWAYSIYFANWILLYFYESEKSATDDALYVPITMTLYEHHGVSNYRQLDGLFNNLLMIVTPKTHKICIDGSLHYNDVTMDSIASQITSLTIVYSAVYSGADQRKHQSSASLAFVRGIHRGPVNSPHKWPVTRKMFPFDDVIMVRRIHG